MPRPIPEPLIDLIAERFKVIGDPMRIRLLDQLREGSATVGQLVDATGGTQQNVSQHLGVLFRAGILARSKEGTSVRYEISDQSVFGVCASVCGGVRKQFSEVDAFLSAQLQPTSKPAKKVL